MASPALECCPNCAKTAAPQEFCSDQRICEECGFVLADETLVSAVERDDDGRFIGHHVPVSGRVPGGRQRGTPNTPKEAGTFEMPASLNTELTHLAQRLGCSRVIKEDARHYMDNAYQRLRGATRVSLPLDTLASASLYMAVRMANLPLTIAETAHKLGKPVSVLGQAYRNIMSELGQLPPTVDFQQFAQRHLAELKHLKCSAADKKLIVQHFELIMTWIEQTQNIARHPTLVAAAIHLAAEACKVKISTVTLGAAFMVSHKTISTHAFRIRNALLALADKLPWLNCNGKNVMQHLQTLLHISSLHRPGALAPPVGNPQDNGQAANKQLAQDPVSESIPAELLRQQSDTSSQNVMNQGRNAKHKAPSEVTDENEPEPRKRQRQADDVPTAGTKHSLLSPKSSTPAPPAADDKDDTSLGGSVMGDDELRSYIRSPGEVQSLAKVLRNDNES